MRRPVSVSLLAILVLGLVGCDHATKHLATTQFQGGPPVEIITSLLNLQYVENRDVAFSLLRHVPAPVRAPLILLAGVLGVGTIALLWRQRCQAGLAEHLGLAPGPRGRAGEPHGRAAARLCRRLRPRHALARVQPGRPVPGGRRGGAAPVGQVAPAGGRGDAPERLGPKPSPAH